MIDGYITYAKSRGGAWIAWHTETEPPKNAMGRDMMECPPPVHFAVGPTADDALARLRAQSSLQPLPGSST